MEERESDLRISLPEGIELAKANGGAATSAMCAAICAGGLDYDQAMTLLVVGAGSEDARARAAAAANVTALLFLAGRRDLALLWCKSQVSVAGEAAKEEGK